MQVSLLIVDPEPHVAEALREYLARCGTPWDVTYAATPPSALELVRATAFDATLVDLALGEEAAEALLETVRVLLPDCIRLVMADAQTLEASSAPLAICHQALTEPCEPFALRHAVEHARRLRDTLGDSGVRALGLRRRNQGSKRPTQDLLTRA